MTDTQVREPLHRAVQQHNAKPMASVVSMQIAAFALAGTLGAEYDLAKCDATDGTFTLDLPPGHEVYIGKPYTVKEISAANVVTIRGNGGTGTIDGAASLVLAAGEAVSLVATAVSAAGAVTWQSVSQTASGASLGVNRKTLSIPRVDLVGATGAVYRYVNVSGNDETILAIGSAITGALTTGDATITASIDGTPVTDGALVIAESGSAAGDVDTTEPSAENVIADGSVLELTVSGSQDATEFADVSVELSY